MTIFALTLSQPTSDTVGWMAGNFIWLVMLAIVLVIAVVVWFVRQRIRLYRALNMVFLLISFPKKEDAKDKEREVEKDFKEAVGVMEQLFANLHGLYKRSIRTFFFGQEYLSFEYAVIDNQIMFYAVVPRKLQSLVEKQITTFYPDAYVEKVRDYNIFAPKSKQAVANLVLRKDYYLPLKTFKNLESDPLNGITNALSKLASDEGATIQVCLRPVSHRWTRKSLRKSREIYKGPKKGGSSFNPLTWIGDLFDALFRGPSDSQHPSMGESGRLTPGEEEKVKAIQEKAGKVGFKVILRIITSAPTRQIADMQLANIVTAFSQFTHPELNSLKRRRIINERQLLIAYLFRYFQTFGKRGGKPMLLNTEELASLFHLPNIRYNKAPTIKWLEYKIAPAPHNLPKEGLFLGNNVFRNETREVLLKPEDRFRHFYVIGQTGTGKSSVFQVMIRQDLKAGRGVAVIDPHGDLIESIMPFIPKERAQDVIYFNPGDTERPMGVNILEGKTPEEKDFVALEAMNIMIRLYGEEIFSPRLQDYFRNGCLTLMDDEEEGGALTDVVRLFTDDEWQRYKVAKVKNPIVRSFWYKQMAATGAREKQEMIPYFASKFGAFVTNTMMRNIIGQTKSAFDFTDVMDNGKILLVNLSKGAVGDINANLLGMMMVTKLQVAAMRRATQPSSTRRDFFLYIDEFQNFITESIGIILSEARKYRLSLNIAHQYIAQLDKGKETKIRDAVFGNIGTMMCYKIGAQDAEYMAKEMAPVFSEQDLIHLDAFKACLKLSVDNKPSTPFSINIPRPWEVAEKGNPKIAEALKQLSRLKYGRDKEFVTREILARIGA